MYRHLLVPLDGSQLAIDLVNQAVGLARALAAKVTFFHARTDYGGTGDGALERVMSPADFNEHLAGEARAILAKAEVVARYAGVEYDSVVTTSDHPYAAILEAAESRGCDLIMIASHGRRGLKRLVLGSETQKVLQQATIPVLVASIAGNRPAGASEAALAVIRDEHRSIGAVIHGLEFLVREARESGTPPSFPLLHAMLHYIREFPEALHHPKEEAYLFRLLRERTREFDVTLDDLGRQHAHGARLLDVLQQCLRGYEAGDAHGFSRFGAAVEAYARAQVEHMALETKVIIPAARAYLTREDWAEVEAAFAGNGDPRFSVENDEGFRQLFARILNLAPPRIVGGSANRS